MQTQKAENGNKGKFFIEENGKQVALMTYKKSGEKTITIDHTEVDSNFRGKGLGEDLVKEAVKFARENDLKIAATCPFAVKVLDKTADYKDVLA